MTKNKKTSSREEKRFLAAIGLRLRELREQRNYSQEELANRSKLATFTVSRMESQADPAHVRITTIFRICRSLGISVGEFFAHLDNTDTDRERRKFITQIARRLEYEDAETITTIKGFVDATLELRHKAK